MTYATESRRARGLRSALQPRHLAGRSGRCVAQGRDQRVQRRQLRLRQRQCAGFTAVFRARPRRPLAGRVGPRRQQRSALQPVRPGQILVHHHARSADQRHRAERWIRHQVRHLDVGTACHRRAGAGDGTLPVPEQRAGAASAADHRHPARRLSHSGTDQQCAVPVNCLVLSTPIWAQA